MIKVSIIIPYYNAAATVERCALALFDQSLENNIEYIFIDDCSTDNSTEIIQSALRQYPHREKQVIFISNPVNQGVAAARLTGLDAANGNYIIFCDADDYPEPTAYSTMLSEAERVDADIAICDYVTNNQGITCYHSEKADTSEQLLNGLLSGRFHGSLCNKLIRHDLYATVSGPFTPGLNLLEDLSLTIRLASIANKTVHIPHPLYNYIYDSSSLTASFNEAKIEQMLGNAEVVIDYLTKHKPEISVDNFKRRIRSMTLYYCAREYRKKYRRLYPEVSLLKSGPLYGFSIYQKAITRCIELSLSPIADTLISIRKAIHRLKIH